MHTVALETGELHRPPTAWPTVVLAIASLTLWATVAFVGHAYALPWPVTVPFSTLAVYMGFTPMHDATHMSVSRRHRWLNEAVGWCCAPLFIVYPHSLFRFLHLRHHKYTNDPEMDPDYMHTEDGHLALFQVWASVLRLAAYVWRHWEGVGRATRLQSALAVSVNLGAVAALCYCGLRGLFFQFWLVPALLGASALGLAFGYIPHHHHHPHTVRREESLYGCTSTVGGMFSAGEGDSTHLLTWLLLGQNYHSIHHLYPTIPFYSYASVWRSHRAAFIAAGVPVVALFSGSKDRRCE